MAQPRLARTAISAHLPRPRPEASGHGSGSEMAATLSATRSPS